MKRKWTWSADYLSGVVFFLTGVTYFIHTRWTLGGLCATAACYWFDQAKKRLDRRKRERER